MSEKSTNYLVQKERNSTQLIERAKQLYQEEQYLAASQVWQQAIISFEQQK